MKRHWIYLLLLLGIVACRKPDVNPEDSEFVHYFGTTGDDLGQAIVQLPDRGFALAGTMHHDGFGADGALIFTDANGSSVRSVILGDSLDDHIEDMRLLPDGSGLILVGSTLNGDSAGWDAWVICTDLQGAVRWEKSYGGSGDDEARAVDFCADGGFAIVGSTTTTWMAGHPSAPQFYLLRLDAQGDLVWQQGKGDHLEDRARSVAVAPNGDWILGGITKTANADYEASLMRVSSIGDSIWTYLGISPLHDEASALALLPNGEVVWAGFSYQNGQDYNLVLEWVDAIGLPTGKRWVGSASDNDRLVCKRFEILPDGTIALLAYTQSKGAGANDMYFLAINPADPEPINEQVYGGTNDDVGTGIVRTAEQGYAFVGYTKSFNFSNDHDIVLMRVDSAGNWVTR